MNKTNNVSPVSTDLVFQMIEKLERQAEKYKSLAKKIMIDEEIYNFYSESDEFFISQPSEAAQYALLSMKATSFAKTLQHTPNAVNYMAARGFMKQAGAKAEILFNELQPIAVAI